MGSLWAGIWPNPAGWSAVLRERTLPWSVQEEWLGTAKLWPHWRRWGLLWPFHRYICTALPVGCGRSYPHMTCLAQQVTPWFRILHSFHVWLPQGLLDVGQSKGMDQRQTWWCSRGFAQVVWEGWILLWGLVCLEAMDVCILNTHRHQCLLWAERRLSSGAQAVSLLPCWVLPFPSPIPLQRALSGWLVAAAPAKAGWKFITMETGAQCVMMAGQTSVPRWSAGSWASGRTGSV